jgi:hypothetical protein
MNAATVRGPDNHGDMEAAARAVTIPPQVGENLVERRVEKTGKLYLRHGPESGKRQADSITDNPRLR